MYPLWLPFTEMSGFAADPFVIHKAKGSFVYDTSGREYIDCMSSLWHVSLGHDNTVLLEALAKQLGSGLTSATLFGNAHGTAIQFAQRLIHYIGDAHFQTVILANSGSEAVETALKLAIQYNQLAHNNAGTQILYLSRAYHGVSFGALNIMGLEANRHPFESYLSTHYVPIVTPYCYRCPFGRHFPACDLYCVGTLERYLQENPGKVVAMILEPVLGAGGILPLPAGYLRAISYICRQYGVLLILDEVVTGFWRAGTSFLFKEEGIVPDIVVLAKSLGGGILPLSATVVSKAIVSAFLETKTTFRHGHTCGGNPLSCAAGLAFLDFIAQPQFLTHLRLLQERFACRLRSLHRFAMVGDARWKGLMGGIELVRDPMSKEPWCSAHQIVSLGRAQGLLLRPLDNVITLLPMLTMEEETMEIMFDRLESVIGSLQVH